MAKPFTTLEQLTTGKFKLKLFEIEKLHESYLRTFPLRKGAISKARLSPVFLKEGKYVNDDTIHRNRIISSFSELVIHDLFIMLESEEEYSSAYVPSSSQTKSNLLNSAGDILDNLTDLF